MKTREFVVLEKRLLPSFPEFTIKGAMMFIAPVRHLLRAFYFDTSGWNRQDFYLEAFFMPLYVPTKYIHFTFGHRIRQGGWNADQPNLEADLAVEMRKEVPYLVSLETPEDLIPILQPLAETINPHCHEAYAYTLVRVGDYDRALDALDALLRLPVEQPWEAEIATRASSIKSMLIADPVQALSQLDTWEETTAHNLGLEDFRG